jgi:hypothetical protein
MNSNRSRIKEALEKNGCSKETIGEILDWYAPSKKEKLKIFASQ